MAITRPPGLFDRLQNSNGKTATCIATRKVGKVPERVLILESGMQDDEENEARVTDRIIEVGSGKTVGLVYAWEDGVKQPLWFDGKKANVVVVVLPDQERD